MGRTAGLDMDQGVVVDNLLKTSHPDVFAVGDVLDFLVEEINY
jgi:NAD(P)H-nitrite reductase large subunit